jgi:hypothetical protein
MPTHMSRVASAAAVAAIATAASVHGAPPVAATEAQTISCPDANASFLIEFTRESSRAHITFWAGTVRDAAPPSATLTSTYNGNTYSISWETAQGTADGWYIEGNGSAYASYGSQVTMWVSYGDVPLFLCTTSIKK